MAVSDLDRIYGEALRKGIPLTCPHCGCLARWNDIDELSTHIAGCIVIELALLAGQITPAVPRLPPWYEYLD